MISTSYPENAQDWRVRFIYDLVEALGRRRDLALALWSPPGELPDRVESAMQEGDESFLHHMQGEGGAAHLMRERNFGNLVVLLDLLRRLRRVYRHSRHDVVHVNWLQNALPLWGTTTPALVTVLGSDYGLLDKPGMRTMLRAVFRQRTTVLAPNASWMAPRLKADFGDVADVVVIPFGINHRWFEVDRRGAQNGLWIAVTRLTRAKIGNLFDWGEGLFDSRRQLHLFGPMQESLELPPWVIWHGPTHPEQLLKEWFPKATGLITLSRHDEGRPQVMLEAMATGLPIIASTLPAHREIIQNGKTGILVDSSQELRSALDFLSDTSNNDAMGRAAKAWGSAEIGTCDDCAERYAAVYRDLQGSWE